MSKSLFFLFAAAVLLAGPLSVRAGDRGGDDGGESECEEISGVMWFKGAGKEVKVTKVSSSAVYSDSLFFTKNGGAILPTPITTSSANNVPFSLGVVANGDKIALGITVTTTGDVFFQGVAVSGLVHTKVCKVEDAIYKVKFEDRKAGQSDMQDVPGSKFDFNDLVVLVSGVKKIDS